MKARLTRLSHSGMEAYLFDCPGCLNTHMVPVAYEEEYRKRCVEAGRAAIAWRFNGDLARPTFEPSLLVRGTRPATDEEIARIQAGEKLDLPKFTCHSFIRDGRIQFLSDCTHALAGKTVDLPEVSE